VAAVPPAVGTPTGSVLFFDGAVQLGAGTIASPGVWTFTTNALSGGTHSDITAAYSGDADFMASGSAAIVQTVSRASSQASLNTSPNPVNAGAVITLTATIAAAPGGVGIPTGTVTFYDESTVIGTGTLNGGVATLTYSSLPAGTHSLSITYGGDTNFQGSTSAAVSQTVVASVSTTFAPSVTMATSGQPVTLSVTVFGGATQPNDGASIGFAALPVLPTPTGTVTFREGLMVLGTAAVDSQGVATLVIPSLPPGQAAITAAYSGDSMYASSVSNIAMVDVAAAKANGPTVALVQRYGSHRQASTIVIGFNDPLDAASAQSLSNYSLVGPAKKHGKAGSSIGIGSAVYNSATNTVTLTLSKPLKIRGAWTLTVNGSSAGGLKNTTGVLLDGAGNGQAGSNYVTTLNSNNLTGVTISLPKVIHAKVRELFHHIHTAVRKGH
jgi:hypothetical protein